MDNANGVINLYTDGSCIGNPGLGGIAYMYFIDNGISKEKAIGYKRTTNNRMEIMAVIVGLEDIRKEGTEGSLTNYPAKEIRVYTDSEYVCNIFNRGWIKTWMKNGWKKSDGNDVANQDLLQKLDGLINAFTTFGIKIGFTHVQGHADNEFNNKCDQMARDAANKTPENEREDDSE